jgi:hypothetical protein
VELLLVVIVCKAFPNVSNDSFALSLAKWGDNFDRQMGMDVVSFEIIGLVNFFKMEGGGGGGFVLVLLGDGLTVAAAAEVGVEAAAAAGIFAQGFAPPAAWV